MKTDFQFSNLLGTVYSRGNLTFTPDGTCLLSPVGNRITVFDLVNNKSYTLPYAHRRNIILAALNPQANLLLTVDEDGRAILGQFQRRLALHHFSFKGPLSALAFSPSGRHFAVGQGRFIEVWKTPSTPDSNTEGELEFAPFVIHHRHAGHNDEVQRIEWSSDSRFFLSASKDLTSKIWSLDAEEGFTPTTLAGHREGVLGSWFSSDQESIYTVSQDGALFRWAYVPRVMKDGAVIPDDEIDDETSRWRVVERHYFMQNNAKAKCASFHAASGLLVVGFSNGIFGLYEMPDFNQIHTLSISQNGIDQVSINASGEWLAFGASKLGQLLVWEWQSESYILKQQGHFDSTNAVVYSPDGQQVITTADDGKIKVWDTASGFCIVTFTEHSGAVTACEFAKRGRVLFTASLDGSIRAWDLVRYRNFRTFTAPNRVPFSCLAVDPSGEVICAGSIDSFDIFLWSVQNGQLLDQLSGHEGPVSTLSFAPDGSAVASGSWDHTVRIWNVFGRTQTSEPLQLQADVLSLAIRPDSQQLAVSTLDGQLTFWTIAEAAQDATIEGRRDFAGGRKASDRTTAAHAAGTKAFNSVAYSVDGSCVLAGGNSKYLCLYDVLSGTLLRKYVVSTNLALDGTQEFLNSKALTEAGPRDLIDTQGEASDLEDRIDRTLPGANRGDASVRKVKPEVRVSAVAFAPTGREFCAASTEGLLLYSLDNTGLAAFDPFDLDVEITPASTLAALEEDDDPLRALVMAFRLNERALIRTIYQRVPLPSIRLVVRGLPTVYLARLLRFVAQEADDSPHLEFNLLWIESLVSEHGAYLKDHQGAFAAELRSVQRCIARIQGELGRLSEDNGYLVEYLLGQANVVESNTVAGDIKMITNGEKGLHVQEDEVMSEGSSASGEWVGLGE